MWRVHARDANLAHREYPAMTATVYGGRTHEVLLSPTRFLAAITLTSVVTGVLVAGLCLSLPAHAEAPRSAACEVILADGILTAAQQSRYEGKAVAWMNEQIAAGRSQFVSPNPLVLCAW